MVTDAWPGWSRPTTLLLLVAALAAPLALAAGRLRPGWAAGAAQATALAGFALALWNLAAGGGRIDLPWVPAWGARLAFGVDGLAALYALLATGIGLAVFAYAGRSLPLHLRHAGRPDADAVPFFGLMALFMGAMVGLVAAQDLLLIFLFWDLTAVASFGLIGFDRTEAARRGAVLALLVTAGGALLFLIGALLLRLAYGTTDVAMLAAVVEPSPLATTAGALIVAAALAKSAQVPLHFWLPRAMAAPTPVSAYLHSAAMVAAGVFLIARLYPFAVAAAGLGRPLVLLGFAGMAVGGVLALAKQELKQILAYSTVAQYGYVVVLLGLGGSTGVAGAGVYVVAHAVAKCALFLTAGAVAEATGSSRLEGLGGLAARLPALAAASGAAAAALAALPLTVGFFKDEVFFKAALGDGPATAVAAVAGAGLGVAYAGRFWGGIFLGPLRAAPHPLPIGLVAPVAVLALLGVAGGVAPGAVAALAEAAGAASIPAVEPLGLAYHLDARPENLMALGAYALGGTVLAGRALAVPAAGAVARLGAAIGPERLTAGAIDRLNRLSEAVHRVEVRDLRNSIAAVLVPAGLLAILGVVATPNERAFLVGRFGPEATLGLPVLLIAAAAAVATVLRRDHLSLTLTLSAVGFALSVAYALLGAPDVALVAVLMETLFALLFLGTLAALPAATLDRVRRERIDPARRRRDLVVGGVAGGAAFLTAWGVLSRPAALESAGAVQLDLTPAAHAKDAVTAILADFRGLDTLGEITVIGIALLGLTTLLAQGGRR